MRYNRIFEIKYKYIFFFLDGDCSRPLEDLSPRIQKSVNQALDIIFYL